MNELHEEFQQALIQVTRLGDKPNKTTRAKLYALCKQATAGDVSGEKPGFFDFEGKARHKAWAALQGTPREEAMAQYISLVKTL